MSEELIISQCSPTLAGIKTGNMFLTEFHSKEQLTKDIRDMNHRLCKKGVRMIPIHFQANKVLIYLYRPSSLKRDLENTEAFQILKDMGYSCTTPEQYLGKLIANYDSCNEIPHEIGLFLGYPPEDVRGFIENRAQNYKMVGTWKVYGNATKAKQTFEKYKKCSKAYYQNWSKGQTIERLTVAV